jgi:hypothetical protein
MADRVTHNIPSSRIPDGGWQVLGELTLPAGSSADERIRAWLTGILNPLQLPASLVKKILQSAQEASARAEASAKFEHIHQLVFAPMAYHSNGQTWGFFRIEKIQQSKEADSTPAHTVEFYLYLEGE